jgi:hypothetical protein
MEEASGRVQDHQEVRTPKDEMSRLVAKISLITEDVGIPYRKDDNGK